MQDGIGLWRRASNTYADIIEKGIYELILRKITNSRAWSISSDVGYYHSQTSENNDGDTGLNEFFGNTGHVYILTSHRNNKK